LLVVYHNLPLPTILEIWCKFKFKKKNFECLEVHLIGGQ